MTVADMIVERLMEWGVEVVFGLPGDGVDGMFEALRTHKDKLKFVQVRHEEAQPVRPARRLRQRVGVDARPVRPEDLREAGREQAEPPAGDRADGGEVLARGARRS